MSVKTFELGFSFRIRNIATIIRKQHCEPAECFALSQFTFAACKRVNVEYTLHAYTCTQTHTQMNVSDYKMYEQ